MPRLSIALEYLARFRHLLHTRDLSLLQAVALIELAGADGLICRIREEQAYLSERELHLLREAIQTHYNLAVPYSEDMVRLSLKVLPDMVTLVTPKVKMQTKQPTVDVLENMNYITDVIERLRSTSIVVNIFIEPTLEQVKAAAKTGADYVTLSTAQFTQAKDAEGEEVALEALSNAAIASTKIGMGTCAAYGLNYQNISEVASIQNIEELFVGRAAIAKGLMLGLDKAVRDLKSAIK